VEEGVKRPLGFRPDHLNAKVAVSAIITERNSPQRRTESTAEALRKQRRDYEKAMIFNTNLSSVTSAPQR
jgi:hypothetical protein